MKDLSINLFAKSSKNCLVWFTGEYLAVDAHILLKKPKGEVGSRQTYRLIRDKICGSHHDLIMKRLCFLRRSLKGNIRCAHHEFGHQVSEPKRLLMWTRDLAVGQIEIEMTKCRLCQQKGTPAGNAPRSFPRAYWKIKGRFSFKKCDVRVANMSLSKTSAFPIM